MLAHMGTIDPATGWILFGFFAVLTFGPPVAGAAVGAWGAGPGGRRRIAAACGVGAGTAAALGLAGQSLHFQLGPLVALVLVPAGGAAVALGASRLVAFAGAPDFPTVGGPGPLAGLLGVRTQPLRVALFLCALKLSLGCVDRLVPVVGVYRMREVAGAVFDPIAAVALGWWSLAPGSAGRGEKRPDPPAEW